MYRLWNPGAFQVCNWFHSQFSSPDSSVASMALARQVKHWKLQALKLFCVIWTGSINNPAKHSQIGGCGKHLIPFQCIDMWVSFAVRCSSLHWQVCDKIKVVKPPTFCLCNQPSFVWVTWRRSDSSDHRGIHWTKNLNWLTLKWSLIVKWYGTTLFIEQPRAVLLLSCDVIFWKQHCYNFG